MFVQSFCCGLFQTNAYLITCEETKQAAIIDPAEGSMPLVLQSAPDLKAIYLTHSHFDHIVAVAALKEELDLPVFVHPLDANNLERPGSDRLPLPFPIRGAKADHYLNDGVILQLGNMEFCVIHTPGHSPGSVCFHFPKEKILFSGDTLFQGAIGNLSFPTANAEHMKNSLKKLALLPPETKVYPGHGNPTTIGQEKGFLAILTEKMENLC